MLINLFVVHGPLPHVMASTQVYIYDVKDIVEIYLKYRTP